jgi:hypothetical protein
VRQASAAEPTPVVDDTAGLAHERSVDGFFQRIERRFAGRAHPEPRLWHVCRDAQGAMIPPDTLARRAPVADPSDLVDLVPWMRHTDRCVRHVALWTVQRALQFDQALVNRASVQDPEDKDYHAIFFTLKRYLRDNKVNHNPAIFDGMYLTVYKYEFPSIVHGRWTQDRGLYGYDLEVDRDLVTLTRGSGSSISGDLPTPVTRIKDVVVNDLGQFVVTAVHPNNEVIYRRPDGDSWREYKTLYYQIWPTGDDVLWLREARGSLQWTKFRRAP